MLLRTLASEHRYLKRSHPFGRRSQIGPRFDNRRRAQPLDERCEEDTPTRLAVERTTPCQTSCWPPGISEGTKALWTNKLAKYRSLVYPAHLYSFRAFLNTRSK